MGVDVPTTRAETLASREQHPLRESEARVRFVRQARGQVRLTPPVLT